MFIESLLALIFLLVAVVFIFIVAYTIITFLRDEAKRLWNIRAYNKKRESERGRKTFQVNHDHNHDRPSSSNTTNSSSYRQNNHHNFQEEVTRPNIYLSDFHYFLNNSTHSSSNDSHDHSCDSSSSSYDSGSSSCDGGSGD
jgi:hypothetical protein